MQDKTAVVTGASRGIGEATALELADCGYRVFLAARSLDDLQRVKENIEAAGGRAAVVELDLQDEKTIEAAARQVESEVAGLDLLVNNAGYGVYGRVDQVPVEAAREMFETNYFGTLNLTRELLPWLRRGEGGSIVNVASGVAKKGFPVMSHYSASKAALESISEAMRWELESMDVTVQVVYPLRTETNFSGAARRHVPEGYSFPSHGPTQSPEDVAEAIAGALDSSRFRIHPHYSTRLLGTLSEWFPGLTGWMLGFKQTVERTFD